MATKYGKKASDKVEENLHEMKRGKLKSGSGKKVTSRKQAIANRPLRSKTRRRKGAGEKIVVEEIVEEKVTANSFARVDDQPHLRYRERPPPEIACEGSSLTQIPGA